MGKISLFTGISLIALSGILFTFERFFAVFIYANESAAVKINGNGSFGPLSMPSIFDNFFVGFLLVLGLTLFVFGGYKVFTDRK